MKRRLDEQTRDILAPVGLFFKDNLDPTTDNK